MRLGGVQVQHRHPAKGALGTLKKPAPRDRGEKLYLSKLRRDSVGADF